MSSNNLGAAFNPAAMPNNKEQQAQPSKPLQSSSQLNNQGSQQQQQTVLPYFLKYKQGLVIRKLHNKQQNQQENNSDSQEQVNDHRVTTSVYAPPSPFKTLSQRFPYDKPPRATSAHQELRKSILQQQDILAIQAVFSKQLSQSSGVLQSHRKHSPATGVAVATPGTPQGNNNPQSLPISTPTKVSSPRLFKKTSLNGQQYDTSSPQNNANGFKVKVIRSDRQSPANGDLGRSVDIAKKTPRIIAQEVQGIQNNGYKVSASSSPVGGQSARKQQQQQQLNGVVHSPREQLNIGSAVSVLVKELPPRVGSQSRAANALSNIFKNPSHPPNTANLAVSNESFLKNELHKWALKKQSYELKCQRIQEDLDKKCSQLIESKTVAKESEENAFKEAMKDTEQELKIFSVSSLEESKRFNERLEQCYQAKYSQFHAQVNLHTAQLQHRYHRKITTAEPATVPSSPANKIQQKLDNLKLQIKFTRNIKFQATSGIKQI